jgi:hypothetical protein
LALIMKDSEQTGEFGFEVSEGFQTGRCGSQVVQSALEQVVKSGLGMLRLDGGFHQLAAVSGEHGGIVAESQSLAPIADGDLAQGVQITAPRLTERDFSAEEQVELAGKGAFRTAGTFGHGFHQPMILGKPVDDETGVREAGEADHDGFRGVHGGSFGKNFRRGDADLSADTHVLTACRRSATLRA